MISNPQIENDNRIVFSWIFLFLAKCTLKRRNNKTKGERREWRNCGVSWKLSIFVSEVTFIPALAAVSYVFLVPRESQLSLQSKSELDEISLTLVQCSGSGVRNQCFKKNSCVHLLFSADWSRNKVSFCILAISNQDVWRALYNYQVLLHWWFGIQIACFYPLVRTQLKTRPAFNFVLSHCYHKFLKQNLVFLEAVIVRIPLLGCYHLKAVAQEV